MVEAKFCFVTISVLGLAVFPVLYAGPLRCDGAIAAVQTVRAVFVVNRRRYLGKRFLQRTIDVGFRRFCTGVRDRVDLDRGADNAGGNGRSRIDDEEGAAMAYRNHHPGPAIGGFFLLQGNAGAAETGHLHHALELPGAGSEIILGPLLAPLRARGRTAGDFKCFHSAAAAVGNAAAFLKRKARRVGCPATADLRVGCY
jgi:hypothetical protein